MPLYTYIVKETKDLLSSHPSFLAQLKTPLTFRNKQKQKQQSNVVEALELNLKGPESITKCGRNTSVTEVLRGTKGIKATVRGTRRMNYREAAVQDVS